MSINKKLLFLLYLISICVSSCTKEDVARREEGYITIVPLWEEDNYTRFSPIGKMKYYLYNINNISISPIIITDLEGKGFTQKLPVGIYRLIGYNTNASNYITFDDSKPSTVVAKILSDDFNPLNLYTISCDNIIVSDNKTIIKEIIPVEIKAKTLRLNFNFDGLNPRSLKGKIEGISTSINLLNGEAFEDENFIPFEDFVSFASKSTIDFRTSGLLYTNLSASTNIPPILSLTLEDSYINYTYTGDTSLENIIKELNSSIQKSNDIILDVIVKTYTQYDPSPKRIQIATYLIKD
jgi:hypothetical protein